MKNKTSETAGANPSPKKKWLKWVNITLAVLLVLAALSTGFGGYTLAVAVKDTVTEKDVPEENESPSEISDLAQEQISDELVEQMYEELVSVSKTIMSIDAQYSENGVMQAEYALDAIQAVTEKVEELYSNGDVIDYSSEPENNSVWMKLKSGIEYMYTPNIEGTWSSGNNIDVITCEPANAWTTSIGLADATDVSAQAIASKLKKYSWNGDYDDDAVNLDVLKNFTENQVILWEGHGGYNSKTHSTLVTGSEFDEMKYLWDPIYYAMRLDLTSDYLDGRIIGSGDNHLTVTSKFFDKYLSSMKGSLVYLTACHSGQDSVLANSFLNQGAEAVIGFTDTVGCEYSGHIMRSFFDNLITISNSKYNTLREALKLTTDRYGANDAVYSINVLNEEDNTPAAPIIFGNSNLRLSEENGSNDVISSVAYPTKFDSAITLVCDVSGSMDSRIDTGETKLSALKQAGTVIIDMMKGFSDQYPGDYGMGVVQFASSAKTLAFPHIDYPFIDDCIQSMGDGGGTNISSGLELGIEQLDNVTASNKVIILMTDGQDSNHSGILQQAEEAKEKNIRIFTVGFGADADESILQQVADATGGEYSFADTTNIVGIVASFMYAQQSTDSKVLADEQGTVTQGETTKAKAFTVPKEIGDLNGILYWPGSVLDLIIVDPNGRTVNEEYPGATINDANIPASVIIEDPIPGKWKMMVKGVETSYDEEPYYAITSFKKLDYSGVAELEPIQLVGAYCLPIGFFMLLLCSALLIFFNGKKAKRSQ
ncbi:MAG: VWA domain-containing protein [Oscillospiraceae bacterium]|jgi:Mg-chelatase subunit ChlD|nr:VWA domain-containing protein [Oscillospiraceae bacterium]